MEQLQHFSHDHLLHLVNMQQNIENENSDEEKDEEDEDEDKFVEETQIFGECNMCRELIYSFHLCYYQCKECDYSLHRFCAELPETLENHSLHPSHNIYHLEKFDSELRCNVCHRTHSMFFWYYCGICYFIMDIVCATISKQKMDHPSHPHQLERVLKPMVSNCDACGDEHKGTFYQCTTCSPFCIHVDCALLPQKLRIEHTTSGTFTHIHPLTLAYSFPLLDQQPKFYPRCRVCGKRFSYFLWHYKCDKCWYYTHVDCATSKKDAFMAIFLSESRGKSLKNFEDNDHPNLLRLPFLDESDNLLKHHFFNQKDLIDETNDGEILNHASHQHTLILFDTNISLTDKYLSLHNPMKRNQLLCDGCLRPILTVPFYKCSQDVGQQCGFVLHKWCARLPELHDHPSHPKHRLSLMPKVPDKFFGVFLCDICQLPSNGFAYGCKTCEYYVDINCAFIPKEITHKAHPKHLLSRIDASAMPSNSYCKACKFDMEERPMGFHCRSCDFYVHIECAFLLPRMIRHKSDKRHTLNLRYSPAENHSGEYFCEICEDEFDPNSQWFYHCSICDQSMHAACAPLILQNEQSTYCEYQGCVFRFINVKFGGSTVDIMDYHPHRLTFIQGIQSDGVCVCCRLRLQYKMIFKCMECDFAIHYSCAGYFA